MEFDNEFSVAAPLEDVWTIMLNANEVAPCVPGATITEQVDDTHFKGTAKIKVGPIQMSYRGQLEMQPNKEDRIIILKAKGTDTKGGGGAAGTVTTTLTRSDSGGTHVQIHSHVDVSGRAAQFGRGLMQDVATKLIKDFANCLEAKIQASGQGTESASGADFDVAAGSPQEATQTRPNGSESPDSTVTTDQNGGAAPAPVVATSPAMESGTGVTAQPARQPVPPAATSSSGLSVTGLLLSVARDRLARGLRALANRLEG